MFPALKVEFSFELAKRIDALAVKTGVSPEQTVRLLVSEALEQRERQAKEQAA